MRQLGPTAPRYGFRRAGCDRSAFSSARAGGSNAATFPFMAGHAVQRQGRVPKMDSNVSALQRAFQLARSGELATVADIKRKLKREGYDQAVVDGGPLLTLQFRKLLSEASERKSDPKAGDGL
jgi:hypothetical protein